jgi:hypothetical protein
VQSSWVITRTHLPFHFREEIYPSLFTSPFSLLLPLTFSPVIVIVLHLFLKLLPYSFLRSKASSCFLTPFSSVSSSVPSVIFRMESSPGPSSSSSSCPLFGFLPSKTLLRREDHKEDFKKRNLDYFRVFVGPATGPRFDFSSTSLGLSISSSSVLF